MFTCALSPGFSFLYYFLDKTLPGIGPYYELKEKMFGIKLSFSEFTGALFRRRKSPVRQETQYKENLESVPQKGFFKNSEGEDFDSL